MTILRSPRLADGTARGIPDATVARLPVYLRALNALAEQQVADVCAGTGDTWVRVDIDDDPDLRARFTEQVPVTFVDGAQHDCWRVDPARLGAALARRRHV